MDWWRNLLKLSAWVTHPKLPFFLCCLCQHDLVLPPTPHPTPTNQPTRVGMVARWKLSRDIPTTPCTSLLSTFRTKSHAQSVITCIDKVLFQKSLFKAIFYIWFDVISIPIEKEPSHANLVRIIWRHLQFGDRQTFICMLYTNVHVL